MSESVCFTKSQITQAVVVKKKKKEKKESKLRFNFGSIMTIKLMPVFFFILEFSHISPLWRPIISSKGTLNGAAHQTQRPPPSRHKWLRQSGRHQKVNTDIHRGAWVAATSMFTLTVSQSLYLSFQIPNYLLTWSQPKNPTRVSFCLQRRSVDWEAGGLSGQIRISFEDVERPHQDTLRPEDR